MHGKTVLITGANSGIGFVTARELAKLGAHVLMVCRDEKRGAHARTEVAQVATGAAPELYARRGEQLGSSRERNMTASDERLRRAF